ncbi:MAG: UDP-N-acetylglucosamine pyrophosphorylase [Actinobacteria bacterium]|nr:UDP-N-acetylglucosamine pyrophosphorylase [Actinomycetota bacterium]
MSDSVPAEASLPDELMPRGWARVRALIAKGVQIPNPLAVDIGDDVAVERISGDGVVIHPGCRIHGAKTVLSAGVVLGQEGPVTLQDCRLGPNVALKGGYAAKAVFLDGANLGLGHHVREGCLLEEESGGAHCVGLKQTILLPFVTLGSLINFCDALMAGGTSRRDHSEVGSSYIHFNFTPSGDKTTPSMFGDVPRGVMLRERPIFLGGQGGAVGPVRVAYGAVVAAGSILRSDIPQENSLTVVGGMTSMSQPFEPEGYRGLNILVAKNLHYLANLDALEQWYRHVRQPFFAAVPLGDLVYEGALEMLAAARAERLARLRALAAKLPGENAAQVTFAAQVEAVGAGFGTSSVPPDPVLVDRLSGEARRGVPYLSAVQALDAADVARGTAWLAAVVEDRYAAATALLPAVARLPRR